MTLISDIVAGLVAIGYATAIGTDVWPNRFPSSPLKCVMIKAMPGQIPSEEMGGDGIDYPGFQIQVRDIDQEQAMLDADAIRLGLNNSTRGEYTVFTTRSAPIDLTNPADLEATDGPVYRFSVDFDTIKIR